AGRTRREGSRAAADGSVRRRGSSKTSAPSSSRSQGSASRTGTVLREHALALRGVVDEPFGGRERALAVAEGRDEARELHQVGLGEERAEKRPVRELERRAARGYGQ